MSVIKIRRTVVGVILGSVLVLTTPAIGFSQRAETAQEAHDRAEREQTEKDHRKHTGAKVVGGSAVGGAVVGGVLGGGKGALIGGAVGAGGGAVANKVRKDKAVKKREKNDQEYAPR